VSDLGLGLIDSLREVQDYVEISPDTICHSKRWKCFALRSKEPLVYNKEVRNDKLGYFPVELLQQKPFSEAVLCH